MRIGVNATSLNARNFETFIQLAKLHSEHTFLFFYDSETSHSTLPENIISIAETTGAKEFHSSASFLKESDMEYINPKINESLNYVSVNKNEVKKMKELLNHFRKDEE